MKRRLFQLVWAALLMAAVASAHAQRREERQRESTGTNDAAATNAPAASAPNTGTDFNSFRIIAERNIFNQSRGPRSARRGDGPSRPTPVIQTLGLVGTMSYSKGDFAFFDGSRSEFKKPVKVGEKIAGYEVKQITASTVKVASENQEFELKVGQQLRKEDDGDWQLGSGPLQRGTATNSSSDITSSASATNSDSAGSGSSGGGSEDEALRRLMEKRAKEMEQ